MRRDILGISESFLVSTRPFDPDESKLNDPDYFKVYSDFPDILFKQSHTF